MGGRCGACGCYTSCACGPESASENLRAASQLVIDTWRRQSGRVFESMGSENPRACAIDEAVEALAASSPPHTGGAPSGEVERLRARVAELERELPEHIGVRGCCELCWRRACSGKECNKCQKAREVLARALQPTTPDPTPSSGEGEDPQDCRGCDGRGFTVGGDNEHYPCRACQLPATPSRQKEE